MNIHFIGIGGINMSALAEICLNKGYRVSGSDAQDSYLLDHLRSLGATIYVGQKKENISNDINKKFPLNLLPTIKKSSYLVIRIKLLFKYSFINNHHCLNYPLLIFFLATNI